MIIDRIQLKNFKLFEDFSLTLHPEFTLLIGENGAGKTSVLDALAVACGVWLYEVPDPKIANSRVPLSDEHIRLSPKKGGDRTQLLPALDCMVNATGKLFPNDQARQWSQEVHFGSKTKVGLKEARAIIKERFEQVTAGIAEVLPIVAYYGAARASGTHRERHEKSTVLANPARRWEAFYDCLSERIRIADIKQWFLNEALAKSNRKDSSYRPGFEVVRRAVMGCIPGADEMHYDSDLADIVVSIRGTPQPFANLSAGQRTAFAMVADIAVKCVTQNNYLVPPDRLDHDTDQVPRVLAETTGVVLIDEIDVHLHPRWQRRIINDLRRTFPKIQFVATTHSPQVVGELKAESLRILDGGVSTPRQAYGMNSNWILDVLMDAADQNSKIEGQTREVFRLITDGEIDLAKQKLSIVRQEIDGSNEDLERASALIERMRLLGR